MNGLASASFLAFGALLVLFGSNATEIIERLDLDYNQFGLVASMLSLGLGIGILSSGPLIDRLPRRPLYVGACLLVAGSALSLGAETTYTWLLGASFCIGLGAGFYETLLNAVIVEESGLGAPRRLLFIHAAATLGASLTPFIIGLLRVPLDLAWYDTFRAAGAAHLALLFGVALLPPTKASAQTPPPGAQPRDPEISESSSQGEPRDAVRDPDARRRGRLLLATICVVTFAYVGVESAYTFFIADYAQNQLGLAPGRATGIVGFFWSGLLVGRLAIGLSTREPNAMTTASLALVACAISVGFFAGYPLPLLPIEATIALTGFCLGGVFPIMIGAAGGALPDSAGTAVGLAGGLGSLGGFLIPWWTGTLATSTSLATGMGSLAGWLFLLAAAAWVVHHRQNLRSASRF